jgi:hypothetical protein
MYGIPYISKKTHLKVSSCGEPPPGASPLTTCTPCTSQRIGGDESADRPYSWPPYSWPFIYPLEKGRGVRGVSFLHWKFKYSTIVQHFLYFSRGNLESGSFTYMRNSVCKYIRNSAEFREFVLQKIPRNSRNSAEFRLFFKKFRIPSEVKNALPWTP